MSSGNGSSCARGLPSASVAPIPPPAPVTIPTRLIGCSTNGADGHVRVARDVGHVHAAQAGLVDLEPLPAVGDLLDRDPALHARQGGAEAAVHTVTEADRDARLQFDVELVGALERTRVARRGAGDEEHREAGGDRAAVELAFLDAEPPLVLRRRPVPEDLVDG